jgi:hypothetical protein
MRDLEELGATSPMWKMEIVHLPVRGHRYGTRFSTRVAGWRCRAFGADARVMNQMPDRSCRSGCAFAM